MKYIGQTKRPIETRFAEHVASIRREEIETSFVAKHMVKNNHLFTKFNLKVEKIVQDPKYLDAYESCFIQYNELTMNSDQGPITSNIFKIPTHF